VGHRLASAAALLAVLSVTLFTAGCGGLASTNPDLFPQPPQNAISFWGHACLYIDVGGTGIVTDPVFEKHTIFRFRKLAAPPPSAYADTRVILVSHAHPDHLSAVTIRTFPESATVLCPEPSAKYLEDIPQKVIAMKPGETFEFEGGTIHAVLAYHPGGRYSFNAEDDGRALGYVIESEQGTVFYSGDSDPFGGFEAVGNQFRPDVTILNINGHMHGTDAIFAALATRARMYVPAHYGAYGYMGFGAQDVPRDNDQVERALGHMWVVLAPGESVPLPAVPVP
jgi:L-ascorbate metabolism protein UlaG (beta-lactamase superfamily)